MQTAEIMVCNMGLFGNGVRHFWLDELSGILERFAILEFPHKQDFYSIIIIEQAHGELTIDHQKLRLDKPKVIIIKPRCISHLNINRNAKGKIICFTKDFFSLRYNNNILNQFSFLQQEAKPYIRLNEEQKQKWDILIKLLFEEYIARKQETNKVVRSYLNILLFELERLYHPIGFAKTINIKKSKVHEFEDLIEQHFKSKKMPNDYAKLLFISPNYLNKICKEETGQTAGDLIRKRIIMEAQRLLKYTHYSIKEIADKLGFDNTAYFITFFKKQTHTTPEQFRKHED